MPANEFLRVSMLFPSYLDVSVLVLDNFLNLLEILGSQILRFSTLGQSSDKLSRKIVSECSERFKISQTPTQERPNNSETT